MRAYKQQYTCGLLKSKYYIKPNEIVEVTAQRNQGKGLVSLYF